jgi:hypothetical protein
MAGAPVGHEPVLHLLGDAELVQHLHQMDAGDAAGCGIGDEDALGGEEGLSQRIGCAGVGPRPIGAHGETEIHADQRQLAAGRDAVRLGECLRHVARHHDHVESLAAEHAFADRAGFDHRDVELMAGFGLEPCFRLRDDFPHAVGRDQLDLGGLCSAGDNNKRGSNRRPDHGHSAFMPDSRMIRA